MTWNYRIVHRRDGSYGLHEVYYDDVGEPVVMTENAVTFECDSDEGPEGVIGNLEMALKDAKERPVFEEPEKWPTNAIPCKPTAEDIEWAKRVVADEL